MCACVYAYIIVWASPTGKVKSEGANTGQAEHLSDPAGKWQKRRENGRNVTSFRAWPLWPATWIGYELGGSVPHQCR